MLSSQDPDPPLCALCRSAAAAPGARTHRLARLAIVQEAERSKHPYSGDDKLADDLFDKCIGKAFVRMSDAKLRYQWVHAKHRALPSKMTQPGMRCCRCETADLVNTISAADVAVPLAYDSRHITERKAFWTHAQLSSGALLAGMARLTACCIGSGVMRKALSNRVRITSMAVEVKVHLEL